MNSGILYVYKEAGMTSFDVVYKLRKILKTKKIGHTGTLDPNAEGLLIVLVGNYTKLLPYCEHHQKGYRTFFKCGIKTDSADQWGNVIKEKAIVPYDMKMFSDTLAAFKGDQFQIPPMYSAKKVNGVKLYELARKNIVIERRPIPIHIYDIAPLDLNGFEVVVSNGCYIRVLIEDILSCLDNLATMTSLLRYQINQIHISESKKLEDISETDLIHNPRAILRQSIGMMQCEKITEVKNGVKLEIECDYDEVLLMNHDEMLAIYKRVEGNLFKCERGLWV